MDHRQIWFREGLNALDTQSAHDLVRSAELKKLCDLMQVAAFWACDRTPQDWAIALRYSRPIISVWDQEHLIGFARATSDGIYRATIWDVVIHPDYRGEGLGRKLVQTLLAHPHMNRVERVSLMTTHHQSFYEGIGFEQNASTTMVLYQHNAPAPLLSEQQVSNSNYGAE
ncbi:Mycothiol acetyltransferase [Acaryochloris thomasi RCC1774]|uniref:Mycothiol acetyltransferase n=1 Tax=Acaryochloris thomasi RCC1774 TaxID=1764569 RepID=A0A2W1JLG2_9CYAN|nr:GNAT family N-acetyltransferase [Acaryochloris thomasi]PZD72285.1 Mycothiol acetyltransferase [Acaryochloris thomasi RCC1774]